MMAEHKPTRLIKLNAAARVVSENEYRSRDQSIRKLMKSREKPTKADRVIESIVIALVLCVACAMTVWLKGWV